MFYYLGIIFTGLLSGMSVPIIGIGGGAIILPILMGYYEFKPHLVVNVAQLFYIIIAGITAVFNRKNINIKLVRTLLFYAVPGMLIGAFFGNSISAFYLKLFIGIYLLIVIFRFIKSFFEKKDNIKEPHKAYFLFGLPAGFLCGSIGIAGGSIYVPLLHILFNVKIKKAVINSISIIFFNAFIAFFITFYLNSVKSNFYTINQLLSVAVYLISGGIAGLILGTKLNKVLSPQIVKIVFIIILTISVMKISFSIF